MTDHSMDCCSAVDAGLARRGFLKVAALGSGAALFAALAPRAAFAAGGTDVLLLSCMDYRLMDDVARYMEGRGLKEKYDHVILAGASLGVLQAKNPAWGQTFWEHVGVAVDLHAIKKVVVLDHRDCGAYKVFIGKEHLKDAETEKTAHAAQLRELKKQIGAKQPKLEVELLLMGLDGKVETIA
jgi:hypothetical protein